ncbi:MAG: hypothetical protein ACI9WU_003077 [Myxococcota bacterium]|jgi:hypothetical protein
MRSILMVMSATLPLALFGGCNDSIEDRFYACRDLVADKDERDASLDCWTTDSRPLIENLLAQRKESARVLDYLESYSKLLDYDDVVAEPEIHGDLALLTVAKGKRRQVIVFVKEEDAWRINPVELAAFWRPLNEKLVRQ